MCIYCGVFGWLGVAGGDGFFEEHLLVEGMVRQFSLPHLPPLLLRCDRLSIWDGDSWSRLLGSQRSKRSPSGKAVGPKAASVRSPLSGKKMHRKSAGTRSPSVTTRRVTRLKKVVPVREGKSPKGRRSRARAVIRVSGGSVTLRKASKGETPAAVEIAPSPLRQADATVEEVGGQVTDTKKATIDRKAIAKQARVSCEATCVARELRSEFFFLSVEGSCPSHCCPPLSEGENYVSLSLLHSRFAF